MTLLTAVNSAQRLLSLPVTTGVVSDGQDTTNLLLELAKREVADCARRHDWPALRRTQSFTASLASLQSAPGKPTNFDRAITSTFWNDTKARRMHGPLNDQEWALVQGQSVTSAVDQYVMFRYDGLHIYPVPTAADTITYEYIINTPWETSGGSALSTPTADSDVSKLPEELLLLGLVWRYKQAKDRAYAEDLRNYELRLQSEINANKGASRVLSIAPADLDWPPLPVTPDTGFGT